MPASISPVKLTVALPTYNRAKTYLPPAIHAILAQTYQDFELLVLDNGSADDTAQFILGLNDPRIRYIRNPVGTSVEFNFMSAYHIGLGQRIIVTHDDDIMEPDMLEKQMRFMDEHPDVKLVWSNVSHINELNEAINAQPLVTGSARLFAPGEYILQFTNERLWPLPSTVMMERALVRGLDFEVHYFQTKTFRRKASNADVAGLADVIFPAYANVKYKIAFIDEPLLRYRIHGNQYTYKTNISTPGVYLYRELKDFARRSFGGGTYDPLFDSHIARFSIQDKVCSTEKKIDSRTLKSIQNTLKKTCHNLLLHDAVYPLLPVHILLKALDLASPLDALLPSLPPPESHTTATGFLYQWAKMATAGHSIFAGLDRSKRVVILGSAFVSALLILEAKKYGLNIVFCIDSNANQQGVSLLNVPIHAPDWLAGHKAEVDLLIFSSEKNQESNLRELVERHAGNEMSSLSWKELLSK